MKSSFRRGEGLGNSNIRKMEDKRPRIIDVLRKPVKCPVCGERVVDIIYGTGDMSQIEFFLEYRQEGIVGGDNIPRRPPVWECSCGCKRFRKVNADGTDAPVKVKLLKNLRKRPAKVINWETELAMEAVSQGKLEMLRHYEVEVTTEMGEKEVLSVTGVTATDAVAEAKELVANGRVGLKGGVCKSAKAKEV